MRRLAGYAFAMLLIIQITPSARATPPVHSDVESAMEERLAFGLQADRADVERLLAGGLDPDPASLGLRVTSAELDALNLEGRAAFVASAAIELLPAARREPGFAGAWQDQRRGGELVLAFTDISDAGRQRLAALAPKGPGVRFEAAVVTLASLERAENDIWSSWKQYAIPASLVSVAIDEHANRLELGVQNSDEELRAKWGDELAKQVGVPVALVAAHRIEEQGCVSTGREPCYSPMKAGAIVHNGSATGPRCTMGFHVEKAGDDMWLTAGHCGWAASNSWYMKDYGTAMAKVDSEYDHDLGQDALLVQFPNDQDSVKIFDSTRIYSTARNPVQGESICASLGRTDQDALGPGWDCGTVRVSSLSWIASNGYIMRGADADGIAGATGDSGSPMVSGAPTGNLVALGIWNLGSGGFARVGAVMSSFGVTLNDD